MNAKDNSGNTALHVAAESGEEDVAKILIENGADVNFKNDFKETPLHIAAMYGKKFRKLKQLNEKIK